jgi:hypothetical protein
MVFSLWSLSGPGMFLGTSPSHPIGVGYSVLSTGATIRLKLSRHGLIMPFSADAFPRLVAFDRFGVSGGCVWYQRKNVNGQKGTKCLEWLASQGNFQPIAAR